MDGRYPHRKPKFRGFWAPTDDLTVEDLKRIAGRLRRRVVLTNFYAVSRAVGMAAAYACVVSDCVEGPAWDDGHSRIQRAVSTLQDLVVETLTQLARESAREESADRS